MSIYEQHVLPHIINMACSVKPVRKQREKVVPLAGGDVLEIGVGSGLNFSYYDSSRVRKIWGLEPSEGMRKMARRNLGGTGLEVEFIDLPGEEIPLEDESVDTVVITYTLCTIPDVEKALAGMRRVLKKDGRLLFTEHGRAPDDDVRKWQDRLNPAWRKVAGGCNMNRDIPALLEQGGFRLENDERMYVPGPRVLNYNYWGSAVPR